MIKTTYPLILSVGIVCSIMSGCAGKQHRDSNSEPVPVRTITLQEETGFTGRTYVGSVTASRTAVLSCSYPGTLKRLDAKVGDMLQQGDTVAVIESQSVLSTKEMADATLAQAEDGYRRLSQVYDSGSVAEVKMIEIQTQLSKARASAQAAREALDKCTVKAPFPGVVGEVFCEQGVQTGVAEPLIRLMDVSSVEIDFSVPEKELGSISTGQVLDVEVPALDGIRFRAAVMSKGISASELSHSYRCTLSPESKIPGLMPGMVCKVYMSQESRHKIVVPASVVRTDGQGRYVWTVKDSRVEKKYVTVGDFTGKGVSIASGLEAGDHVITQGAQKVSTGMVVTVK